MILTPETSAILLIDKAQGWTSHDAAAVARGALGIRKIGHSGTLDPMATGLLILLLGRATKLQDTFQKLPKSYSATIKLGIETDTWDAEGDIVKTLPVPDITMDAVLAATKKLTGDITHPIPFYSAKKVGGVAMYKQARKGNNIEREAAVKVYSWEDIKQDGQNISFKINCGSGTYIRSLGLMLGKLLGTTAHITQLRRLSIGEYKAEGALPVTELKTMPREEVSKWIKNL